MKIKKKRTKKPFIPKVGKRERSNEEWKDLFSPEEDTLSKEALNKQSMERDGLINGWVDLYSDESGDDDQ